jgi:hypothetical protein
LFDLYLVRGELSVIDRTTFLFHEEDDPIFCPITHMLALAFADNAFEAPSLKSAKDIFKLKIRRPFNSVQLMWKESMLKTPIFRQAVRCADGFQTSPRKALCYSTFDYYLERLGCVTGFEEKLSGYCVRRGTGNVVDGMFTFELALQLKTDILRPVRRRDEGCAGQGHET